MDKVILDSDILILISRNDAVAISFASGLESSRGIAISSVSIFELIVGCQNKNDLVRVKKFLGRFESIHISEVISATAVALVEKCNLSHGLLMPDALIAATALVHICELATLNSKDFRFIDGLRLADYP